MYGVIVVDAGRSRSTNLGRDAYVMIISWISSWVFEVYQLPNSNLFTHRLLFFSREATSETYGPRVSFHHFCLCDLFSFAFIFRSIKPKIQNYLAAIYSYFILSRVPSRSIYPIYYKFIYLFSREGLTTPLTRRVASICSLCAGAVYVVLHGSPTGSITLVLSLREIPTVVVLHHPFLFGEIST